LRQFLLAGRNCNNQEQGQKDPFHIMRGLKSEISNVPYLYNTANVI